MSFIKKSIFKIAGSRFIQNLLEKNIFISQQLLGIGSGTEVSSSGEEILAKKLLELKLPEVTIFDVGANKGDFSALLISRLGGKVKYNIHLFEPSSSAFKTLNDRLKTSANIVLNNFALGKREGTAELFFEKAGSGLASLTRRKLEHFNINFNESEKIVVETLDRYAELNNIERIDLLKIDVEGHELDVLNGAKNMFEKKLITMVSFEFGGSNIDTRTYYQDFYYFFKQFDMEIFRIIPAGNLAAMKKYREDYEQFKTTNFLAIRKKDE
jgi:FkbM family methyltransferase